ncbi:conserved Plasmodium protein, unknown function [Plasmodium relictum]|uniref:Kelch domain-containing protein n=1 Tax=Plasmodium relictum TaxID=85471 RepID=A0A1J1H8K5_PLARL|nr:conserved Plasmodium protein, unknown function [Plasmodium relictum]CRH01243.1 conserved Plasmodium protein, unknown function [Plasmodium relictum]
MSKINGSKIDDINKSEKQMNSFNSQLHSEENYKMNKSFNISNYNLDLIKCLQDDSGIYFILDPTKAINEKKNSEVYDIFIPENSDGVTLHVQKVNDEYKCIGVSITKKGIDINTGTRIFNTKIADWLEQLFHFNKTLACNNSSNNAANNNSKLKRVNSSNSVMSNSNNNTTNSVANNNKNTSSTMNSINNNSNTSNNNSNTNNTNNNISNGNNLSNNKFNNYNNIKHTSPGVQQPPVANIMKNSKNNYDSFQNNENYNSVICNKKTNKVVNQQSCNLNHSNSTNNIVSHAVAAANLTSQSKDQTHQHIQQIQHAKQMRLHQMNNPHSHKPHLLSYHNVSYDDKNNKLYNNINSNNLNNKNVPNGNSAAPQISSTSNNEMIKNSKLGCTNRQKNINHHIHNHSHSDIFNSQNSHQNNHIYNHKSQQSYNENYGYRPTLFNLLEVLANHNITTPDQRVCIRGIVTDFLNNELPHGKIYAYIGAVVGHDILHDIIRKLEKDPNRNVVPDASGLARIEAAFGLSKSSYDFMNNNSNNSSVNNISNVLFNHRNLSSNILNNHIYSSILSNVATNNMNNNHALNNDRLNIENEELLNSKASNDINNLLKYTKNEKYSISCNNLLNLNKKNNQNANMLNLRCDNVFNNNNNKNNNNFTPHDYICATRNLNMQCSNKNNFSDDEEELMKAIKKNIETYKMNNIKNILISSVFGRIKWLKIMNESPHAFLYGHSIVKFGNKLYMFGGSNNKNKKVPFNHTLTFSLIYYNYKLLPLGGSYPEERDGHTTHLISLKNGLSIFLFGGSNENIYYNDIYILDMETRKWSLRAVKGKLPLPRDQHSSLVYPAKSEHLRGEKSSLTEGVIIFGGKCLYNNNIINLNDMWIFLFQLNMWVRINYLSEEVPIGRHGMNLVWSDTNTLCLFGGECYDNSKNFKERKLLDDMWIFKLHTNKNFISNNSNLRDGNSCNPSDIIQTDVYNNQSNKACCHKNAANNPNSNEKNSFENNHSANTLCNNNSNTYISDKESSDNEKDKKFTKKIRVTGEWQREVYEGKIGCRSNYSSIFITQRHQDFKGAEPKTIERLMLLCSGITYVTKDNKRKIVSSDEIYVYFFSQKRWYLLKGKLYNEELIYNGRQRHVGCFFESKNVLGRANKNPIPCIFIQGGFKKNAVFGDAWLLSLTGENPLRIHEYDSSREKISTTQMPLYYFRDTHSISLLYSFCTLQKWLFGAFANLVDNCIQSNNPAENVFIKYELTPEHDGMLSIQDDGEGLDFNAMNRILRMYGNYKNDDKNLLYNNNNTSVKKHNLPNSGFVNHKVDEFNDDQSDKDCNSNKNVNRNSSNSKNNSQEHNKESLLDENGESSQKQKQKNIDNEKNKENQNDYNYDEEDDENEKDEKENEEVHKKKRKREQENNINLKKENDENSTTTNINNKEAICADDKNNPEDSNELNNKRENSNNEDYDYKTYDEDSFYNANANNTFDLKYGVGFKMAYARISSSCAIMSRTVHTIGIGLLSLELMNHCDAKELATPLCMWKLPNKELINRNIANKSEHRHHQKLLMSYTPFNSPSLLAEQINILGTYSGTRLLYWDFRDDMDFIVFCSANNNIYLSSSPLSLEEIKYGKKRKNASNNNSNSNKYYCVEDVKLNNRDIKRKCNFEDEKIKKAKTEKDSSVANNNSDYKSIPFKDEKEGICINEENIKKYNENNSSFIKNDNDNNQDDLNNENNNNNNENQSKSNKNNIKRERKLNANSCDESKSIEKNNNNDVNKKHTKHPVQNKTQNKEYDQYEYYNSSLKKLNLFEYNAHLHPSISKEKYNISSIFPLWDHPKDSIDYCLSTYLYWLYLRRSTNIFLQNTLLIPTCMRNDKNNFNEKKKKKKKKRKNKKKLKKNNNGDFNKKIIKKRKEKNKESISFNKEVNDSQYHIKEENTEENKNYIDNNNINLESKENADKYNIPIKNEIEEESKNEDIEKNNDKIEKRKKQKTNDMINNDIQNEENENEEDQNEKDQAEIEKKKLQEALEHGVKQEKKEGSEVHKMETEMKKDGDLNEDDEEDEEEEEEDKEDEDEDDEDNDDENEDDDDENEEDDDEEEEEKEQEQEQEQEKQKNQQTEQELQEIEKDYENDGENIKEDNNENIDGKKIKKIKDSDNEIKEENEKKAKKKNEKNENYVNIKKGNVYNNEIKNEENEKVKKENYVNLYMENLKIKDEYYINNTSKYTLYSFLKRKLYKQVEFHYLFTPSDYEYGSFIMLGFLNDNDNTSIEVKRVCEAGILLYYKNRLIKRLDAPFIDSAYNLSLSKYPPTPSLYEGNLYKYALTVIVNVPNWLKPSISKQEFIHENNYAFLVFKKKLIGLIKHYLLICRDNLKLKKWKESRDLKLKNYLEKVEYKLRRSKNESENEYEKAYKIVYNDKDKVRNEDMEKEEELEREENRQIVKEIEKAQEEKRQRENEIDNKQNDNYNDLEEEEEDEEEDESEEYTKPVRKREKQKKENNEEEDEEKEDVEQTEKGNNGQDDEEKEDNELEEEEDEEEDEDEQEDDNEQEYEGKEDEQEDDEEKEEKIRKNQNNEQEVDEEEEDKDEDDDDEQEEDEEQKGRDHGNDDGDDIEQEEQDDEEQQNKQQINEEVNKSEDENYNDRWKQ